MNRVFVLSNAKKPLMPCHPARARELLKKGKAAVYRMQPFTIILKDREDGDTQPVEFKADPGSKATGIALVALFERGRVLVARLLATRAPLLVADEPAAGLDPDAQLLVLELLRREADADRAVLLTLHDLTTAVRACDRLVVLKGGKVIAEGPPRLALSAEVLDRAFGVTGEWLDAAAGPLLSLARRPLG